MNIIEAINNQNDLIIGNPPTSDIINFAEEELNINFSKEYRDYISTFGFAIFESHELTGICKAKRLNVVDVTIFERNINPNVPLDWYVIEEANIDGIVIWQAPNGEIYQTFPNGKMIKLCDSLVEYIALN